MKPDPKVSALLSFIFNGLGQIYNGQIKKGLMLFFLSGVSMLILLVGAIFIGYQILHWFNMKAILCWGIGLFFIGIIGIVIIGIYSISDAYHTAEKMHKNHTF
ncbi:MAG: hypothetical protein ACPL3Q_10025 [Candidatus Ratteibacteria bacterium]